MRPDPMFYFPSPLSKKPRKLYDHKGFMLGLSLLCFACAGVILYYLVKLL